MSRGLFTNVYSIFNLLARDGTLFARYARGSERRAPFLVFFSFVMETSFSTQTKYLTAADINIGIGSLLETLEMMSVVQIFLLLTLIFASGCLHSFTFARSLTSRIDPDLQKKRPVCAPLVT